MVNCGGLLKNVLVALVMVAAFGSGSAADEKLATCCKTVTNRVITDPITGYMVQRASSKCVRAVIFQTERGLFCCQVSAPWVRRKIIAFERAKARATPSSTVSLLSIITSTASPLSLSPPSFASTSETMQTAPAFPAEENKD